MSMDEAQEGIPADTNFGLLLVQLVQQLSWSCPAYRN